MRVRLSNNSRLRSPFFLFMSHCRWTCASQTDSDAGSDRQGANDILGLVEHAQLNGEWEELQSNVTDLEELSPETAFITEDMLQSMEPASSGNLNDSRGIIITPDGSLRDVLVTHQNIPNFPSNQVEVDNVTNGNVAVANGNHVFIRGSTVAGSNRSSIESNNSNNMFYELQSLHSEQLRQGQGNTELLTNQNLPNQNNLVTMATTHLYENVPVVNGNARTIEVHGVTNTSSSDSYVQSNHSNRESDVSLPSDLIGAARETESCLTDNSGAASGSGESSQPANTNTPAELGDILFRFDRQFRGNRGFGFTNWRWSHRISSQSNGSSGEGRRASTTSAENTLQKQARWLRRLQVHQSTATPTNSNSNSLRSNSSGSSSSVRGGNLQQEWYFYDPRLVPQHRTQRLTVQTDHNRIQTTSYVSNIIGPPTYDELSDLPEFEGQSGAASGTFTGVSSRAISGAVFGAASGALPNLPEHPPPFEEMEIHLPMGIPDSGDLPSEPPPPYMDSELPPVYDLDPSALIDPPPLYDDHSFSEDDLSADPMDPDDPMSEGQGQGQSENFILTQSATVASESDGNFILSAIPNLRSVNRHGVFASPDNHSITSDSCDDVTSTDCDAINDQDSSLPEIERREDIRESEARQPQFESSSHHRPLPLEELFRDTNSSEEEDSSSINVQPRGEIGISNHGNEEQLPSQLTSVQGASIFPGYQLLHNSPELPPWSRPGHVTNQLPNQTPDDTDDLDDVSDELDDVTVDLVDDLPGHQDNVTSSRSLANFPGDDYPSGFVAGSRPPLRWSRGMGVGRWNAQNWAI